MPDRPANSQQSGIAPGGRTAAVLLAACLLLLAGCLASREEWGGDDPLWQKGRLHPWPATGQHEYVTAGCRVRTNTSLAVAEFVATVLDLERRECARLWGVQPDGVLTVQVFRSRTEMAAALPVVGLGKATAALSNLASGEILLAFEELRGRHPAVALLHEGAHQYLAAAFDFRPAPAWRQKLGIERLPAVPWWLHEGIAARMESATISSQEVKAGAVNLGRCRELQTLLRSGRQPELRSLLRRRPAEPHGSGDYAVAWGLVHYLLENPAMGPSPAARQARLIQYLESCRQGFWAEDSASAFEQEFARQFPDRQTLLAAWHRQVAAASAAAFERHFVASDDDLESWEAHWRQAMLRLD